MACSRPTMLSSRVPLDAAANAGFDRSLHRASSKHVLQRSSEVLACSIRKQWAQYILCTWISAATG